MSGWSDAAYGMGEAVLELDRVSVRYPEASAPTLREVDLSIEEGELVLVVGRTGSGKSTLLGTLNGHVPHFTGGLLTGRVRVLGRDTATHRPRDLADIVGVVGQDPVAGFVTDTVEEELAYGMEQLALPPTTMRKRVEETLDLLGIADLRAAPLRDLSGGQQQRVAIGSVLTTQPRILVLDEPTSALDPTGAEEVLATLTRLVHDLGVTIVIAEHRLERVIQYADRVVEVVDGRVRSGSPAEIMRDATVAPPVVELGRYAAWSPLPVSIRDARRAAAPLRARLGGLGAPLLTSASRGSSTVDTLQGVHSSLTSASRSSLTVPTPGIRATGLRVDHGRVRAVRGVDLAVPAGRVTALMGRNGAGKSSLLWALHGTGTRSAGRVAVTDGSDPATLKPVARRARVGLVPQTASDLIYLDSVGAECDQADAESAKPTGTCRALLDDLAPGIPADRHPRDLSEGQKLALVLAIQLTAGPDVVLLDEPTRGLDYPAKTRLAGIVRGLAGHGHTVLISTHDVEFVADAADEVVVMAEGEVVAHGPTPDVVAASAAFAPQVAKVLAPAPLLTVAQVRQALAEAGDVG
ncbi:ABC transporter ATP-binding protein [Nostocoides jenkinsii]|uniref:Putative enzyme n=1 Tax=Nostocoides jenkinsii Ben 74 TaxID=1193518 RepID=A0A077MCA7_9MICO|nr:ABC transporter ATP-binding protein [Tetrasphaera jenkinsii]CCI52482.1 putative enzyme [Tetrasphaera jenkinsii Ben 74]